MAGKVEMTKKLEAAINVVNAELLDRNGAAEHLGISTMRFGRIQQEGVHTFDSVDIFGRKLYLKTSVEAVRKAREDIKQSKVDAREAKTAEAEAEKERKAAERVEARKAKEETAEKERARKAAEKAVKAAEKAEAKAVAEAAKAEAKAAAELARVAKAEAAEAAKAAKAEATAAKKAAKAAEAENTKPEPAEDPYEGVSVKDLRAECKERELKHTGTRAALVARLTEADNAPKSDPETTEEPGGPTLEDLLGTK